MCICVVFLQHAGFELVSNTFEKALNYVCVLSDTIGLNYVSLLICDVQTSDELQAHYLNVK